MVTFADSNDKHYHSESLRGRSDPTTPVRDSSNANTLELVNDALPNSLNRGLGEKSTPSSAPSSSCQLASSTSTADAGFVDNYQGWYDVQGCGLADDCRWVGGSGSGGDPSIKTEGGPGGSRWSCRLAGTDETYTPQTIIPILTLQKQRVKVVLPAWLQVRAQRMRVSYEDAYRGWYDAKGCGVAYDDCRWVGGSGSGGDPAESTY